ncbi:MAG: hypothetical protein PHT91_01010 [Candidatus Nanoarchaeia archaeon]|nr:hypothetical protein [Candidatus Nanoarchaeia archaeon]MDD5499439.1 hypothetical protein [Candidatus Nanoarchaeia archaeon]
MNKSQTFGFDLLIIVVGVIFFSQLIYASFLDFPDDYFLQRSIENHELLRAAFSKDNSLSYLDCALSFDSFECRQAFNNSIEDSLNSYLMGRNYLLSVCGVYDNFENRLNFTKAIPYFLNLSLPGGDCAVYFSIYYEGEVAN